MNKFGVIKEVAYNLSDLVVDSVPVSLTGSSLDMAELIHPLDDQLKGNTAYIYDGAGAGQERIVSEFNIPQNQVVFDQVFSVTPSLNSQVAIFKFWKYSDYKHAVDRAMGKAKHIYLEERVATMALVGSQYEYPVPSGFEYISTLRLVPSSNTNYSADTDTERVFELPPRMFRIEPNAVGTYVIVIDPRRIDLDNFTNHWVNVVGQAKPDVLGSDNTTVPDDIEEYIIAFATAHLASMRINENKEWITKFRLYKSDKDDLEEYIFRHRQGKGVGR